MATKNADVTRLEEYRERTFAEIDRLRLELRAEIEPAPATDEDAAADVASEIFERAKTISLIQTLEARIHSLDHAIALAQQGRYGICDQCGVTIPAERLEIMPETTLCVRCAGERESGGSRRPSRRRQRTYEVLDDSADPKAVD